MWITFDSEADALYVSFRPLGDDEYVAYTDPVDDRRNVDYDALDAPVGLEFTQVGLGIDLEGLPQEAELREVLSRLSTLGG
jgi:uncharacterized protein YuzE